MVERLHEITKKDLLDYGIRAALLVGALAGHFFLVQAKVDMLADKMERMEDAYIRVVDGQHKQELVSEATRSRYIAQIEANTKKIEFLEDQVYELRETNREILTILKEMRKIK